MTRPTWLVVDGRRQALGLGAACGVWVWFAGMTFHVVPGLLRSVPGLLAVVAVAAGIGVLRARGVAVVALQIWTAIALLVACTPLVRAISGAWVRDDTAMRNASQSVGAVVVLSAGLTMDSTIGSEAVDRLLAGLELARKYPGAVLVTTRVEMETDRGPISSDADQARIVGLSGGGVEWLKTITGHTTHDEALLTERLLAPRGIEHIAVVTSPMHSRRACATFEARGFEVTCAPARIREFAARSLDDPWSRLQGFSAFVYELLGMVKYGSRSWFQRPENTGPQAAMGSR